MLTLKRYWNPTEAALDRTLLANYNVFCSLFDEHVNALGYFNAMPVRLMVADEQLERAGRLLIYAKSCDVPDDEVAAADDQAAIVILDEKIFGEEPPSDDRIQSVERNNPWEILALAYLFLIPGAGFLLERLPLLIFAGGRRGNRFLHLSTFDVHLLGSALICIGAALVASYVYTRKAIVAQDKSA
ncbi:MAG: DUF2007 domain-containing protein [Chthoniobacterales bacterium]